MNEAHFYNAIALHTFGNYGAIKKMRGEHASWKESFDELKGHDATAPDPERAWEKLGDQGIDLFLLSDDGYPALLRTIPHPPFGIYVHGAMPRDKQTTIGIVGTRKATLAGKALAKDFAMSLAKSGCVIASGLAFGIDVNAHRGAIDAGSITLAISAGGLDEIYPSAHRGIAREIILKGGAIISEYPIGERPLARRFIERNRIVSGLSRGIVVIEAPEGSGSLATAHFAFAQGRDVFVVPGNISHPNFKGSHALIRQGATLVTSPSEILEKYGMENTGKNIFRRGAHSGLSREETLVFTALAEISIPADIDKLTEITRLEPRIVNQAISFLLIKDFIKESESGYTI